MNQSLAVITFATGEVFYDYATNLIASLKEFFPPHDVILFTDNNEPFNAINICHPWLPWPDSVLYRFHAILAQKQLLEKYEQVFFMDVDMVVCDGVKLEEIASEGITATFHPSYVGRQGTFETRISSTAYVPGNSTYFHTCPIGGKTIAFLNMCQVITKNIDIDRRNGIIAVWQDESHVNRYLFDNPPIKVLTPSYCFPGLQFLYNTNKWMNCHPKDFKPKIRHIEKTMQERDIVHNKITQPISLVSYSFDMDLENIAVQTVIRDGKMVQLNKFGVPINSVRSPRILPPMP
jgi:hypothetical protein